MIDNDFHSARHWAHELIAQALEPGDRAVDATMGNGHDTLFLAEKVGPSGRVYAFDVQAAALENTRRRLEGADCLRQAQLFQMSHARMAEVVPGPVDAVLFNLGWLPGGDHAVTTRVESTLQAVDAALSLLAPGGLMTVCVYPGHGEGAREAEALLGWARSLDAKVWDAMLRQYVNQANDPPFMLAVHRRPGR